MDLLSDYLCTFVSAQRAKLAGLESALPGVYGCATERSGDAWALFATRWNSPNDKVPFSRIIGHFPDQDSATELFDSLSRQHVPFAIEVLPQSLENPGNQFYNRGFKEAWSISWLDINIDHHVGNRPTVTRIDNALNRMREFADVFVDGYEYPLSHGSAWHSMAEYGQAADGFHNFIAYISDEPAGCGSIYILDDIAFLDAAATIPGFRRQGVQTALLEYRIELARKLGCKQVFSRTSAGSASERNMLAAGLRVVSHSQAFLPNCDFV